MIQPMLFIIGNPRSGTSLLRLMLTCHTKITVPPECGYIVWLHKKYHDWSVDCSKSKEQVENYINDLFLCKKFETWGLTQEEITQHITTNIPKNYKELSLAAISCYCKKSGKIPFLFGDKNNFHTAHLGLLEEIFGNPKFIHIVRDGRDVACSYREVIANESKSTYAPKFRTEMEYIAKEWVENVTRFEQFSLAIPESRKITIRYEDLTAAPPKTLSKICAWLNIEFESNMLDFHIHNRNKLLEPAATLDWKKRTTKPISNETVGRYKKHLMQVELDAFHKIAWQTLKSYSYL